MYLTGLSVGPPSTPSFSPSFWHLVLPLNSQQFSFVGHSSQSKRVLIINKKLSTKWIAACFYMAGQINVSSLFLSAGRVEFGGDRYHQPVHV